MAKKLALHKGFFLRKSMTGFEPSDPQDEIKTEKKTWDQGGIEAGTVRFKKVTATSIPWRLHIYMK